ncbi:ThuA domain-containing protein [Maribacter confluentis]|uniref:ThuA domain-containing protein n=1 Tax=Maribacter confluentis TaxID=1656093 RepID=A0ABT8RPU4_9FLAO|nr:ThuA domain-containing protein [Maribacter confluentis]MDO1512161.1 ThuA domain-containing protein [Maribacter confluentis]
MKNHISFVFLIVLAITMGSCSQNAKNQVLVFSKTDAFRHESIDAGKNALTKMSQEKGFEITFTEDAEYFNEKELKKFNAVIFLNTTGDVLNDKQQNAFERYIQAGGGYVGVHAATDTEYEWPWYGELVGAYFQDHPIEPSNVQKGTFTVTQKDSWATKGMPIEFEREDEFYSFKNISPNINVVLTIDDKSYKGGTNPDYHPMSWYQEFNGGKSFYTAMGHTNETYSDPLFLDHLWAGIHYVVGGDTPKPLDYAMARPEENRFTKVILAEKLDEPMELAILDSERILFIQRKGEVRIFNTKTQELKTIANIPVSLKYVNKEGEESVGEDGLLGLNIDPNFADNNWIYLYYSPVDESANVLSRFELKGEELVLDSEKVLLTIPTQREQCCHTGGSIAWDKEGNLYLSTGDNTSPRASVYSPSDERPGRGPWDSQKSSANTNDLRGKIIRIKPNDDGTYSIPDGNLFPVGTPKTKPEIYTMGHRNPFRISVDQHTGFLYWGEVGPDANEPDSLRGPAGHDEIGQARKAGNFGWPHFVANNKAYVKYDFANEKSLEKWDAKAPKNTSPNNTGLEILPPAQEAFVWYPYAESEEFPLVGSGGRNAMAGPVYYSEDFNEAERAFPKYYDGKFFAYEWMRGWIMAITMDEEGNLKSMERFMPSYRFSNPMDMQFAANGDLYMLEYGSGWFSANDDARLIKIEYNGGNRLPKIQMAANKIGGAIPFNLKLSAEGTVDPDMDDLSYVWEVSGDNNFSETIKTQDANITLKDIGVYDVKLTVNDGKGGETSQTLEITAGNEPPVLSLEMPNGNKSFFVPNTYLEYDIQVTDKEDGSLENGISSDEVSVSFDFLAEGFDKIEIAQGHRAADASTQFASGKSLMNDSDCMACHKQKEKSIGPSYMDVAMKYKGDDTAIEYLSKKIISGGGGVWGDVPMAAHPQLSVEEAADISKYILSLANEKSNVTSLPTKGSYLTKVDASDQSKGVYIVRAAYEDHGANKMPSLMAEKSFVLRSSNIGPHDFDEYVDVNKMSFGGSRFAIPAKSGAYMTLQQIDLNGLSELILQATAPIAQLNAAGGKVELRLGSPKGTLIGESGFLEPSEAGGFAPSPIKAPISLPDSFNGELQDLYLVFKNERIEIAGTLMVVLAAEFKLSKEPNQVVLEATNSTSSVSKDDFYTGKWDLTFKGTPNGDSKMIANISRKDGQLTGELKDSEGKTPAIPMTDIQETTNGINFSFTAQGFNVSVKLLKDDQNHLNGKMMDMFEATAVRIN